jgi:hypothetical protein
VNPSAGTIEYSVTANGSSQPVVPLTSHTQDGQLVTIDVSLNRFVNATQLTLSVTAVSPSGVDQVAWNDPRVEPANAPPP